MTREYAESSFLLADKALHDNDVIKSIRTYAKGLFAEIAVRIVAFGVDMIIVLFLMQFLNDHVLRIFSVGDQLQTTAWVLILVGYFAASWTSPLRATPMQFLFGMRVLHESGSPLTLRDSLIRSVALVALWGFALFVLNRFFEVPSVWLKVVAVALLLYVPSITARRQGLHDYLARSVVINKRALRNDDNKQRMREFLADRDPATLRSSRPSVYKMITDAVVLAIPLLLMTMGIEVANQKNMYARMAYAMGEARGMQVLVDAWYETTGNWPANEAELGMPLRNAYPAGGYYVLEDNGVIRIQFEVRPELRNGSILLVPEIDNGELTWRCRSEGDIARRYLPSSCRH